MLLLRTQVKFQPRARANAGALPLCGSSLTLGPANLLALSLINLDTPKMDDHTRKEIDILFDYVIRCDARILAFQMIIPELFRENEEQKEAFEKSLEQNYKILYSSMREKMKGTDPVQFSRIYGDSPVD